MSGPIHAMLVFLTFASLAIIVLLAGILWLCRDSISQNQPASEKPVTTPERQP